MHLISTDWTAIDQRDISPAPTQGRRRQRSRLRPLWLILSQVRRIPKAGACWLDITKWLLTDVPAVPVVASDLRCGI